MANYLVTGGAGFIGSHLVELLYSEGHQITVLDDLSVGKKENIPNGVKLVVGSICDKDLVEHLFEGSDGCFHLAAIPSVLKANTAWLETNQVNLGGTITLFDAARKVNPDSPTPVVYASSAAVYGDNPDVPLKESSHITPVGAYGADKYACELHARAAGYVHHIPTFGLRFFNVYGPRQDPLSPYTGVISIFMDRMKAALPLTVYGEGHQTRDFIYAADIARICLLGMKHASTDAPVYNACRGQGTSVLELVKILSGLFAYQPELIYQPARIGEVYHSVGDPMRAKECLGFYPSYDLDKGLEALYRSLFNAA